MARSLPRSLLGGRYVLEELIGVGGMGAVYRATQTALNRRVAIKFLRPEHSANPGIVEHFRSEALAAARVVHPNLVTVLDVGELADATPFLVMEYVPGKRLGTILRAERLGIEQIVGITRQVLAALAEAHRCGVVHADVKSDNVLVEHAPDGSERVKLIDFGLARIGRTEHARDASGGPTVAGTPEFMAPEVVRGDAPTPSADLYSVGIVLYELLTGAPPFAGETSGEIMSRHLSEPVVPPSLRRPERAISRALDDVVMRALAKVPADRFPDADQMSVALHVASSAVAPPCWCRACGTSIPCDADRCFACGSPVPPAPEGTPVLRDDMPTLAAC